MSQRPLVPSAQENPTVLRPSTVLSTVKSIEPTPSGKFVRVYFTPICFAGCESVFTHVTIKHNAVDAFGLSVSSLVALQWGKKKPYIAFVVVYKIEYMRLDELLGQTIREKVQALSDLRVAENEIERNKHHLRQANRALDARIEQLKAERQENVENSYPVVTTVQ